VELFGNLPAWAVVLLGLLAAVILIGLNLGWLLAAKGMLISQRRRGSPPGDVTRAGHAEPTRGSPRRG
jgi:hypothetical protein